MKVTSHLKCTRLRLSLPCICKGVRTELTLSDSCKGLCECRQAKAYTDKSGLVSFKKNRKKEKTHIKKMKKDRHMVE